MTLANALYLVQAIQKAFDSAKADQLIYFDHGNYVVTKTIQVPKNIKIVGEIVSEVQNFFLLLPDTRLGSFLRISC